MTRYYVFQTQVLIGCWADSEQEARGFIESEDRLYDIVEVSTTVGVVLKASLESEPDGSKPFTLDGV